MIQNRGSNRNYGQKANMFKASQKTIQIDKLEKGKVTWQSPSNIAIVKYWGKYGDQLPRNPSISLTLSEAHTQTNVTYSKKRKTDPALHFLFNGKEAPDFKSRIEKFRYRIISYFPFLNELDLIIESHNSFPHSSGIASSASAMSALALCFCSIEEELKSKTNNSFLTKASFIARLGSGSASRSIYNGASLWGKLKTAEHSSNEFAISLEENLHSVFKTFHDDILIISGDKKAISSSLGHQLMEDNPYASERYKQAELACQQLLKILSSGDIEAFGQLAEKEAMHLHALMMSSQPGFILMLPATLEAIRRLWQFRKDSQLPIYFTLDAGPNIHLLYPDSVATEAKSFIKKELSGVCEKEMIIQDRVGGGPKRIR